MRRTEQAQGLRLMKFEEVYARTTARLLSQAEAAEVLGVSERTFRRWRDRYEAEGAEGLYDRRLGRLSARRAPLDEVARVLALFDTRYWDFTAKHFHEKLVAAHGCERSYNWVRLTLQAHGRRRAAPRRGAHRRKRPRRALPGMMVHQDGSRHAWVPGRWWDLIVTMDDATSTIYSAFFVDEEGTMSSFRALSEVIAAEGLFGSLYADRATHYWHTPEAGGKVDKDKVTQVGRALMQLGIERDPGRFARGQGAVRAHVRAPCRSASAGRNSGSPASPTWPRHNREPQGGSDAEAAPATPWLRRCRPSAPGLRLRALQSRRAGYTSSASTQTVIDRQRQHRALSASAEPAESLADRHQTMPLDRDGEREGLAGDHEYPDRTLALFHEASMPRPLQRRR